LLRGRKLNKMDIWKTIDIAIEFVDFYKRRQIKKIPLNTFFLKIESKINEKLNTKSKNQILEEIGGKDNIRILRNKSGRQFILIGEFV